MKDMIEYFKLMITPPVEEPIILVDKPSEIDYTSFMALEGASIVPIYKPSVHGIILLGEPTEEEAKLINEILLPGAHVILIPEDIGYKGVISLEDKGGLEVRDAIFVADENSGFYYTSKASRGEREAGLSNFDEKEGHGTFRATRDQDMLTGSGNVRDNKRKNIHPTVKPIEIMEWCARDIEPSSTVVDPFMGSGTTGIAMSKLHHDFVGIELNPEYAKICEARMKYWKPVDTKIISENPVEEEDQQVFTGQVSLFDF
jgi:hypothetical protein